MLGKKNQANISIREVVSFLFQAKNFSNSGGKNKISINQSLILSNKKENSRLPKKVKENKSKVGLIQTKRKLIFPQ